jgi:hypothetical protein
MSDRADQRRRGDRVGDRDHGAALVMAISFVVAIGALSGGLASLVTSSVSRRAPIEANRNQQYAADGAIEDAIGRVRRLADPAVEPCVSAAANHYSSKLNGVAIRVDCTNALGVTSGAAGAVVEQRNVVFEACRDTGARCGSATAPIVMRAQVNFELLRGGGVARTHIQAWSARP